jgi:hypothetical protein
LNKSRSGAIKAEPRLNPVNRLITVPVKLKTQMLLTSGRWGSKTLRVSSTKSLRPPNRQLSKASATLVALKMVVNALSEVDAHNGRLPTYDDPLEEDDTPSQTFLQLTQQYAGDHVSEAVLLKVIEVMPALFPAYHFPWK